MIRHKNQTNLIGKGNSDIHENVNINEQVEIRLGLQARQNSRPVYTILSYCNISIFP